MGEITVERWEYLVALDLPVGVCPLCSAPMKGEAPVEAQGKLYLDSRCVSCGHESSAPGGRRLSPRTVVPFRRRPVVMVERPADHQERAAGG